MSKQHLKVRQPSAPAVSTVPARALTTGYIAIKSCRHGLMMYNLNDLFISRSLDLYGEWCEAELHALGQVLHPGNVVVDVGANIGTHTVFFAKKVSPGGVVYAFEPQRLTFGLLCANLTLNGLTNAVPIQAGAGEKPGSVMIPTLDPASPQNFGSLSLQGHAAGEKVEVRPIDSLELSICNLIKIDVEGMELEVIRGAVRTIQTCRPLLFVENNNREGSPETVQSLFDLGYSCWWHIAPYYSAGNFFHNKENVFANYVPESNMVCVPRESKLAINGFEAVLDRDDSWVKALTRLGAKKA